MRRYMDQRQDLVKQKIKNGGIIGITKGDREWMVQWPCCVKKTVESFTNPVAACARHNHVLLQIIGEEAVLCDPLAAVKLKEFKAKRGPGRPPKEPQNIT